MGRSYSSMHILSMTSDMSDSEMLALYREYKPSVLMNACVIQKEGITSIYDRSIGFDIIEEKAQIVSREFMATVFYASVFDDSVFVFGLCANGNTLSRHISGDDIDEYGLSDEQMSFNTLQMLMPNCSKEQIAKLMELQGEEFETALQNNVSFYLNTPSSGETNIDVDMNALIRVGKAVADLLSIRCR